MESLNVYALLDELQEEIDLSPGKAFSKNKSIDPKLMSEIIADIRAAVDEALESSKKIVAEKEQVLSAARAQAEQIVKDAEEKAKELVQENNITRQAYEQGSKMLEKAKHRSFEIKKSAFDYANEIFADLEEYYKESMDILSENKIRLRNIIDAERN